MSKAVLVLFLFSAIELFGQWEKVDGNNVFNSLHSDGARLFGTSSNGVMYSDNDGITWASFGKGLEYSTVTDFAVGSKGVYWCSNDFGTYKLTCADSVWQKISYMDHFVVKDDTLILGNFNSASLSQDGGITSKIIWRQENTGSILPLMITDGKLYFSIADYAGRTSSVMKTKNSDISSQSWQWDYVADFYCTSMAKVNGNYFAAAKHVSDEYSYYNGLFESSDGFNWNKIDLDTSCRFISTIVSDDRFVMVSTNMGGIMYSSYDSQNWIPLNDRLPNYYSTALTFNGHYFFTCVSGNGLYRLNAAYVSVRQELALTAENDYQIYPIPADDRLIIRLNCEAALGTLETVKIMNETGETVKSIPVSPTDENTSIDISNLTRGVYFISYRNRTKPFIKV